MKKIKLALLLIFAPIIAYPQEQTFIIKAIDAKDQVDSVIMGYRDNATVGIDTALGESDYFDKPFSDIDIRSIQRDTVVIDSLWLFSNNGICRVKPFPKNIDLKKDFRNSHSYGEHFIIQIKTKNYPVTVKISYLNIEQHIEYCSYLNNYEDNLINGELKYLFYGLGQDTIIVFNDSSENRLIGFHPFLIESVISQNGNESGFTIYPNPVIGTLNVNLTSYRKQTLTIYNSKGVVIDKFDMKSITRTINVSLFPKGLYLIRIGSLIKKFIKQ